MSETIIPDKITDTISSIVQKGNVFAKMKKIEGLVYGCGILVTIFGSSIIMNSFINTRLLLENNSEQDNYQILIRKQNDKLQTLHYKIDKVIEFNKQFMMLLFDKNESDRKLSQQNDESTVYVKSSVPSLSRVTSLSSLTYEQSIVDEEEEWVGEEERAEKH